VYHGYGGKARVLPDLLSAILPNGTGQLLMYSLFADETTCAEKDLIIVAGYLIGSRRLNALTEKWAAVLDEAQLRYFHMREGHHTSYPKAYAALIALVNHEHVTAGFCASVKATEYDSICQEKVQGQSLKYWMGGSYSFCVGAIAQLANQWLDANNPGERDMAYVFDAGNPRQHEADMFLRMIASDALLVAKKCQLRYYSHSFVDSKRREQGALQAADILAANLSARQRLQKWTPEGGKLIDAVKVYSVHYGASGLRQTVELQKKGWEFYGSLKRATVLRP